MCALQISGININININIIIIIIIITMSCHYHVTLLAAKEYDLLIQY